MACAHTDHGQRFAWSLVEPYSTLWFVYLLAVFSVVSKLLRRVPAPVLLAAAAALQIAPVATGWFLLDEFSERYVYFVAGWLLAPQVFRLADAALRAPGRAWAALGAWALANGVLAFAPSPVPGFATAADLPGLGLVIGAMGAMAIVALSALVAGTAVGRPLSYAGERSIAIYLAFFLPMAATRMVLQKTGIVGDVGWASVIVTTAAVLAPLALERLVAGTRLDFLFVRPVWARLKPRREVRLQPAE